MQFLRKNTAVRITVGPFVDVTDAKTPELNLTVSGCHLTMTVDDDDNTAANLIIDIDLAGSGTDNDMVHITNDNAGYYDLELTAAQTNYSGRVSLCINDDDVHLPVFHRFMILNQQVYDSLFGSDLLEVDTQQINGANVTGDGNATPWDGA